MGSTSGRMMPVTAREPVNPAELDAEQAVDDAGEQAVAAQQLDPCVSADKRRGQVTDHDADVQPFAARDFVLARDVGDQQAQGGADQCGYDGDGKGVFQGVGVVFAGEEAGEVFKGQAVVRRIDDALVEDQDQGIHHKNHKQRQDQESQERPDGGIPALFHAFHTPSRIRVVRVSASKMFTFRGMISCRMIMRLCMRTVILCR